MVVRYDYNSGDRAQEEQLRSRLSQSQQKISGYEAELQQRQQRLQQLNEQAKAITQQQETAQKNFSTTSQQYGETFSRKAALVTPTGKPNQNVFQQRQARQNLQAQYTSSQGAVAKSRSDYEFLKNQFEKEKADFEALQKDYENEVAQANEYNRVINLHLQDSQWYMVGGQPVRDIGALTTSQAKLVGQLAERGAITPEQKLSISFFGLTPEGEQAAQKYIKDTTVTISNPKPNLNPISSQKQVSQLQPSNAGNIPFLGVVGETYFPKEQKTPQQAETINALGFGAGIVFEQRVPTPSDTSLTNMSKTTIVPVLEVKTPSPDKTLMVYTPPNAEQVKELKISSIKADNYRSPSSLYTSLLEQNYGATFTGEWIETIGQPTTFAEKKNMFAEGQGESAFRKTFAVSALQSSELFIIPTVLRYGGKFVGQEIAIGQVGGRKAEAQFVAESGTNFATGIARGGAALFEYPFNPTNTQLGYEAGGFAGSLIGMKGIVKRGPKAWQPPSYIKWADYIGAGGGATVAKYIESPILRVVKNQYYPFVSKIQSDVPRYYSAEAMVQRGSLRNVLLEKGPNENIAFVEDIHKNLIQGDISLEELKQSVMINEGVPTRSGTMTTSIGWGTPKELDTYLVVQSPSAKGHWGLSRAALELYGTVEAKTPEYPNVTIAAKQFGYNLTTKAPEYEGSAFSLLPPKNYLFLSNVPTEMPFEFMNLESPAGLGMIEPYAKAIAKKRFFWKKNFSC